MDNSDSNNPIENAKGIPPRETMMTDHEKVGISRMELLLLMGDLHKRLDAGFDAIRELPLTTARLKTRTR